MWDGGKSGRIPSNDRTYIRTVCEQSVGAVGIDHRAVVQGMECRLEIIGLYPQPSHSVRIQAFWTDFRTWTEQSETKRMTHGSQLILDGRASWMFHLEPYSLTYYPPVDLNCLVVGHHCRQTCRLFPHLSNLASDSAVRPRADCSHLPLNIFR